MLFSRQSTRAASWAAGVALLILSSWLFTSCALTGDHAPGGGASGVAAVSGYGGCAGSTPVCLERAVELMGEGRGAEARALLEDLRAGGGELAGRASFLLGVDALGLPGHSSGAGPGPVKAFDYLSAADGLASLGDYVLYYRARALEGAGSPGEAASFLGELIERYPDSVLVERAAYERAGMLLASGDTLASLGEFAAFVDARPASDLAPEALARFASLALSTGSVEDAARAARRLIIHHPASHAASGPVVELISRSMEGLTPEERLERAKGLKASARFESAASELEGLKRELGPGVSLVLSDVYMRLRSYEDAIREARAYLETGPSRDDELKTLYRLATAAVRSGDTETLKEAEGLLSERFPSSHERARTLLYIARDHEGDGNDAEAAEVYERAVELFTGKRTSWAARDALWRLGWRDYRGARYDDALGRFTAYLDTNPSGDDEARVMYWRARALEKTGEPEEAAGEYARVCREYPSDFYCIAATGRAGAERDGEGSPPGRRAAAEMSDKPSPPQGLFRDRHYRAARELAALGLDELARRELTRLEARYSGSRPALEELAGLYYSSGDYYRALRVWYNRLGSSGGLSSASAGTVTAEDLLYPPGVVERIRKTVPAVVDPYLVASVMKSESTYNAGAFSGVGAVGLMQIMPSTGRYIAGRVGHDGFTREDLLDAGTSIRFGAWYLEHLSRRFDGNVVLTVAGYNAGPGAVRRWTGTLPSEADEFIESIPYPETREYAKKVLEAYRGFTARLGEDGPGAPGILAGPVSPGLRASGGGPS